MRVQDFMTHNVCTVPSSATLRAAGQAMWDRDCGALPVVDDDSRVIGMLTDRDVCMAACMADKPLSAIPVTRAMSKELFSCRPDDTVAVAEATMRARQVRRLPVLDERGRLLGILSLNDIAIEAAVERTRKQRQVTPAEVGMTLAAICHHRTPQPPILEV